MRRALLAAAIFSVVVAAILAVVLFDGTEETASDSPDPTPTPIPTPTEDPEPVLAPLTGVEIDDPGVLDRTVVALKVDNAPRARPQVGLDDADILFTELVEGGTTRFIALYHSVLPTEAGPVRSGRDVDAQVLPAFSPVFGISGAAGPTYAELHGAGLLVYEEGQANAFRRDGSRPAPHNLMASTVALEEAAGDLPPASQPWPFDADSPDGGDEATGAQLTYSPFYSAAWDWDEQADTWLRSQEGAAHTGADGSQLAAETVVVARVTAFDGAGQDAGGNPIPEVDAVGEGEALVLRDGRSYPARWRKRDATSQFEWLTPEGQPLPLRPGRTWVELVPESGAVDVATPATGE